MLDERLPKRLHSAHMDGSGLRGGSPKQWVDYVREDFADCRVENILRHGRLEGRHRMSASTQLIYGLESM